MYLASFQGRTCDVYWFIMRSSITARLSRAGFGLLAIWCLGCSSFDVMIDALLRAETDSAGCVMPGDARAPASAANSEVQSPPSDGQSGCGCDHCIAVQAAATEVAIAPHATPETLLHRLGSAISVDRQPLVPPPIAPIAI